mmetsp:Transcript_19767/g.38724  ORF Transcript_19767/g.38724 Transcript_19767/m.38724 type:complete len:205 (+) Transcript_19767:1284-1898(+)
MRCARPSFVGLKLQNGRMPCSSRIVMHSVLMHSVSLRSTPLAKFFGQTWQLTQTARMATTMVPKGEHGTAAGDRRTSPWDPVMRTKHPATAAVAMAAERPVQQCVLGHGHHWAWSRTRRRTLSLAAAACQAHPVVTPLVAAAQQVARVVRFWGLCLHRTWSMDVADLGVLGLPIQKVPQMTMFRPLGRAGRGVACPWLRLRAGR